MFFFIVLAQGLNQFQNGRVFLKKVSLLSPRPVTKICLELLVVAVHSHASLISVDYKISWNAVLRRRRRYRNFHLAPPNLGATFSRLRSLSHHEAHALHERLCPASSVAF